MYEGFFENIDGMIRLKLEGDLFGVCVQDGLMQVNTQTGDHIKDEVGDMVGGKDA